MRAEELMKRYEFDPHEENGLFVERNYEVVGEERAASGCIYYYVRPGERALFHQIDCDEYWCFNAGATLELWIIGTDGKLSIKRLGLEEDAEITVRFAAEEIFAARLDESAVDGTFLTCITVPRFDASAYILYEKEKITEMYPATLKFWE